MVCSDGRPPEGSGDAELAALFLGLAWGPLDPEKDNVGLACSVARSPVGDVTIQRGEGLAVNCHRFRQRSVTGEGDRSGVVQPQLRSLGQRVKFGAMGQGQVIPLAGCRFPVPINPLGIIVWSEGRDHGPQQAEQGPRPHGQGESKGLADIPGQIAVHVYGFTLPPEVGSAVKPQPQGRGVLMLTGEPQDLEHQQPLECPGVIVESQGPELAALELALEIGRVTGPVQTDGLAGTGGRAGTKPHGGEMEHSRWGNAFGLQDLRVGQGEYV